MDVLKLSLLSLSLFLSLSLAACVPELDSDESLVVTPRVLAVFAEPAEAPPNAKVRYRALVADGSGTRRDLGLGWFHCLAQKPLAELGPISRDCLYADRGTLNPLGTGHEVEGTIPAESCALFGPNPPMPMGDEPPGRPVDADETGGYALPIIAGLEASAVLYEQRLSCGLSGVAPELALAYGTRYHPNVNPAPSALEVRRGGVVVPPAADGSVELAAGEQVELALTFPVCPLSDACGDGVCGPGESASSCAADCTPLRGCGGAERYLQLDRARGELVVRREALRVAWFSSAGSLANERTGLGEQASEQSSSNGYVAASTPGRSTIWAVLRDSRGGVGAIELVLVTR
jgi:hypothetical protein